MAHICSGVSCGRYTSTAEKAHVNRKYASWLLRLGRVRDDRLFVWLPLKDLDVKGEATVVRMQCEVHNPGSLLHCAMHQLYLNWRMSRGRDKRLCWWGRMRSTLRRIWPQCDIDFNGDSLTAAGDVTDLNNRSNSRAKYIEDTTIARWKVRQNSLFARQVPDRQQEHILYSIFQEFGILE